MEFLRISKLAGISRAEREALLRRSEMEMESILPRVSEIISRVRRFGDKALLEYTEQFDGVGLTSEQLRVSRSEFNRAYRKLDHSARRAIKAAAKAIKKFHKRQMPKEWIREMAPGIRAGQLVRPLYSSGVYVPGGLARYPSSLLMAAVPAKVAGVENVIACTPPTKDGSVDAAVLVAAKVAKVDSVFKVGGAHAVAAMAYGTETVPKVDKIVGPGSLYVAAAKQLVARDVRVDFVAGPSEVLVVADGTAEPRFVALDLISQAEHDPSAASVLVTDSEELASKVVGILSELVDQSPRKDIALESLKRHGRIVVARDMSDAIDFANEYAPEHLELIVEKPQEMLSKVKNAASIFLGGNSPVSAGDFAVGPNHILPTGGAARMYSGLSVLDFLRLPTVQELTKEGLQAVAPVVEKLAELESLPGHARSVKERLKEV